MKYRAASLAVFFLLSLAHLPATNADITPVNYPTPVAGGQSVTGQITNIDSVNQMIQMTDGTGIIQTIRINTSVQILRNGEIVQLVDLGLGDTVTVSMKSQ